MTARHCSSHRARLLLLSLACAGILLVAAQTSTAQTSPATDRSPELQRLIGQLDVQLNMTYRANRRDYRRRRDELASAISAWNESARGDVDLEKMRTWLLQAIRASLPGSRQSLPNVPKFAKRQVSASEVLPVPEPTRAAQTRESTPSPVTDTSQETLLPPFLEDTEATSEQMESVGEPTNDDDLFADELFGPKPDSTDAISETDEETSSSLPALPLPTVVNKPVADEGAARADDDIELPLIDEPATKATPERDFWTQHPAARPLPPELWPKDPFRDDPEPTLPAESSIKNPETSQVAAPIAKTAGYRGVDDDESINLNMPELKARMLGYRRGLKQIEAELVDNRELKTSRLPELARTLSDLIEQREFTELYLDMLTSAQRSRLPELPSPSATHQLLADRIADQIESLHADKASGKNDSEVRYLDQLEAAADTLRDLNISDLPLDAS